MINDKELWEKVKNLLGSPEDIKRLNATKKVGKLTEPEYWRVRTQWIRNKYSKKGFEWTEE